MKNISRTVWLLSLVSLFTDMASEMLYPVMPMYLKSIGFSIVLIGFLEGMAEAVAGLSKGYFGKMSDSLGKRLPFVQLGYGISALSKPLMALFAAPFYIFLIRTLDRLGKGVRTGARDALLNAEATPSTKATVFGFHRSADTLGAAIGPAIALVFLYFYPAQYKTLFLLALIPGIFSILSSVLLKEKSASIPTDKKSFAFFAFLKYWNVSEVAFKKLVIGLLLFALVNTSDVFLLLKAHDAGLSDLQVIGVYIFYNLVYALLAFPIGILADKWQLKNVFIIGLILFAVVYIGMAFANSISIIIVLFFVYGIYAAATEGIAKAWIGNTVNKAEMGTATGFYSSFQSICSMLASSLGGLLWYAFGAQCTFLVSGIAALIVVFYFIMYMQKNKNKIASA